MSDKTYTYDELVEIAKRHFKGTIVIPAHEVVNQFFMMCREEYVKDPDRDALRLLSCFNINGATVFYIVNTIMEGWCLGCRYGDHGQYISPWLPQLAEYLAKKYAGDDNE